MKWLRRVFSKGSRAAPGPIPPEWSDVLARRTTFYTLLSPGQRADLLSLTRQFIATKRFWGTGLTVTDEMKLIVAAHACLLILGLPESGVFPHNGEVIIHPTQFGNTVQAIGPDGARYEIREANLGQAIYRGPIRLAWDAIDTPPAWRRGRNLILHEFAHALDFLNGLVDGTPPLATRQLAVEWQRVFEREFQRLRAAANAGQMTLLDPYGATNPAEFFAVATECFFEQPRELRDRHLPLYEQLRSFYRQDPAAWQA